MKSVTITRHIESALLNIPELADFIGKDVEIRIEERLPSGIPERWKPLWEAAAAFEFDEDAYQERMQVDLEDSARDFARLTKLVPNEGTDDTR